MGYTNALLQICLPLLPNTSLSRLHKWDLKYIFFKVQLYPHSCGLPADGQGAVQLLGVSGALEGQVDLGEGRLEWNWYSRLLACFWPLAQSQN